jgi:hypothetical protein
MARKRKKLSRTAPAPKATRNSRAVYDEVAHDAAIAIVLAGGTDDEAAMAAGCAAATLRYWRQKHPNFAADYAAARRAIATTRLTDAIERRTELVNQWIDEILAGTAVQTRKKTGKSKLLGEYHETTTTAIVPDRWLMDRVLGDRPSDDWTLNINLAEPPPDFEDDIDDDLSDEGDEP